MVEVPVVEVSVVEVPVVEVPVVEVPQASAENLFQVSIRDGSFVGYLYNQITEVCLMI